MNFNPFCLSSYLTFRYVVSEEQHWKSGVKPVFPASLRPPKVPVRTTPDIDAYLRNSFTADDRTGILLSGGIDSALLASYLPKGSKAYTIRFVAEGAVDESPMAARYAEACGLAHTVVRVYWDDYCKHSRALMEFKQSPIHAIEVALYRAALAAKADGIETLVVGNGADSTFGGMDKLLSRDWTLEEFKQRYTFVPPERVLRQPVSLSAYYEAYDCGDKPYDVQGFLKTVHGIGIIQSFENAIHKTGCQVRAPFEGMYLDAPLDLQRIRSGESKYLLRALFRSRFPRFEVAEKIPFARPMDQWLRGWEGPSRPEFKTDVEWGQFSGDQRWLLHNLEVFLNLFDDERACV